MARLTNTVCKMCRRENMKLFLKGDRCYSDKCSFERRSYPPGQHGQRRTKLSDFGLQLREKQKLKRIYGMLERQFRVYFDRSNRKKGNTGANLLQRLECRLDTVVYRVGFADSRAEARQLILHRHFLVNGKPVNVPNIVLKAGDEVTVKEKSRNKVPLMRAMQNVQKREIPDWLELNAGEFKGKVRALPQRTHVTLPIEENLVVELYSK
ncbi:MAG: 30S ribosomal protein S4 [Bdellovibrionaceae bacterium]|nr:30S ribosomal protein S4 [Bdellovibrionales bacterium]MCB9253944.1 30S ribosomal protein S4 [Pseudobdellovibrionaceae bacterium]